MPWSEEIICWQWLIFTWFNKPNSPHRFSHSSVGKESACNAGEPSSTPRSGRSAGEGIGFTPVSLGFPCGSAGKESACNVGDLGSIVGFGKIPWRRERLPTSVFWPRESMDCIVHGVAKSWTRLSNFHSLTTWNQTHTNIIFPNSCKCTAELSTWRNLFFPLGSIARLELAGKLFQNLFSVTVQTGYSDGTPLDNSNKNPTPSASQS